jgi:hypothetical protein
MASQPETMTIQTEMLHKAQSLIASDCMAAYRQANSRHNPLGKRRAKPYTVPQRSQDLAAAIGAGNAEQVAAIMLYRFNSASTAF